MPLRIFTVTGIGPAARTVASTIERNSSSFHGRAAPPPLRVTFGTGHPKFMSMWSVSPSPTRNRVASAAVAGSTL